MNEIINVKDLPAVQNVCNQTLREIPFKLSACSIAHVCMEPHDASLHHVHHKTNETYFILSGEGVLYFGDRAMQVHDSAGLFLPSNTMHRLVNTEDAPLENLVVASPSFDPEDVHLTGKKPFVSVSAMEFFTNKYPAEKSEDGATVWAMLSDEEKEQAGVQLAYGYLLPGKTATLHMHQKSDEIYYVMCGKGIMHLGEQQYPVTKGSIAFIPKEMPHSLENNSNQNLEVVCISSPAYQKDDFIKVEE